MTLVEPLLELRGLKTYFATSAGTVKAVDGVSYAIDSGQTVGVVGESGCGKSVAALSVMRLIQQPGRIVGGSIWYGGGDLVTASEAEMCKIRGDRISMIFQEPMTSLNPVHTAGKQLKEAIRLHSGISEKEAADRSVEALAQVGIPDPGSRIRQYPHEMSGGMRQRVMIAMALATNPDLLIADEPTTALDVTIQAQILELMRMLRERKAMAIMLITHDLGVIAEMADAVVVMYLGKVVERGSPSSIFENPHHPYTKGLLASIPRIGQHRRRLDAIEGSVPSPLALPEGCLFRTRCPHAMPVCRTAPPLQAVGPSHVSRCWLAADGAKPNVGRDAPADEALRAARLLSVEE